MSARINSLVLIPLAASAIGAATWALHTGKISEYTWLGVLFACLAEFFGKGFRYVIEGFIPWSKKQSQSNSTLLILSLAPAATILLTGCFQHR